MVPTESQILKCSFEWQLKRTLLARYLQEIIITEFGCIWTEASFVNSLHTYPLRVSFMHEEIVFFNPYMKYWIYLTLLAKKVFFIKLAPCQVCVFSSELVSFNAYYSVVNIWKVWVGFMRFIQKVFTSHVTYTILI